MFSGINKQVPRHISYLGIFNESDNKAMKKGEGSCWGQRWSICLWVGVRTALNADLGGAIFNFKTNKWKHKRLKIKSYRDLYLWRQPLNWLEFKKVHKNLCVPHGSWYQASRQIKKNISTAFSIYSERPERVNSVKHMYEIHTETKDFLFVFHICHCLLLELVPVTVVLRLSCFGMDLNF